MTSEDIYPREWTKILKEAYDKRVHEMDILIYKPDKSTIKLINIKSRYPGTLYEELEPKHETRHNHVWVQCKEHKIFSTAHFFNK